VSDNELQIEITKPAGVEISPEVTEALEHLAAAMAAENDEVAGFSFDPKMGGALGGLGGMPKPSDQWKICWGGYAKDDKGGDACSGVYVNSKDW